MIPQANFTLRGRNPDVLTYIAMPRGNKQKGKFPKSEDLRHRFARDAKHSWQLEMQDLLGLSVIRKRSAAQPPTADGRVPILAAYPNRPVKLRARFKGHTIWATVRRDATIRLNGRIFTSPSLAGSAARKMPTCNGWTFWHYERAPGDWVPLDELRK